MRSERPIGADPDAPVPIGADPDAPVALTFVIPVRHPDNASDWSALKANLGQTLASIAGQQHPSWRAVIAAQDGADLPDLPPGAHAVRVNFPPNHHYSPDGQSRADFHDAVRLDKGRRVLAALLAAGPTTHIMVTDDDDLVSNRLAATVAATPADHAIRFDEGHVWSPGSRILYTHPDFSSLCGTSSVVPIAALGLPPSQEAASIDYIKSMLGSHIAVKAALKDKGVTTTTLPYPGAVYRVGHANAHSRSRNMLRTYLLNKGILSNPTRALENLRRLRFYGDAERREFGLP